MIFTPRLAPFVADRALLRLVWVATQDVADCRARYVAYAISTRSFARMLRCVAVIINFAFRAFRIVRYAI